MISGDIYNLPYTNNFLKVSFKGTGHILVKIILWISWTMCLPSGMIIRQLYILQNTKIICLNDATNQSYRNESKSKSCIIWFVDRSIKLLEKWVLLQKTKKKKKSEECSSSVVLKRGLKWWAHKIYIHIISRYMGGGLCSSTYQPSKHSWVFTDSQESASDECMILYMNYLSFYTCR